MATAGASFSDLGDGPERPDHCGGERDDPGSRIHVRVVLKEEKRKMEEIGVEARQAVPQPRPRQESECDPEAGDDEHELDVVGRNRERTVADRLQQPDLLALQSIMRVSVMLMRKADTSRKIGGITRLRASSCLSSASRNACES